MNACVYSLMWAYVCICHPCMSICCTLSPPFVHMYATKNTLVLAIQNTHSHTHVCALMPPMCVHTHSSCLCMYASLCVCICDIYMCVCVLILHIHSPLYTWLRLYLPSTSVNVCARTSSHKQMGHHVLVSSPSLLSLGLTLWSRRQPSV